MDVRLFFIFEISAINMNGIGKVVGHVLQLPQLLLRPPGFYSEADRNDTLQASHCWYDVRLPRRFRDKIR